MKGKIYFISSCSMDYFKPHTQYTLICRHKNKHTFVCVSIHVVISVYTYLQSQKHTLLCVAIRAVISVYTYLQSQKQTYICRLFQSTLIFSHKNKHTFVSVSIHVVISVYTYLQSQNSNIHLRGYFHLIYMPPARPPAFSPDLYASSKTSSIFT